MEIIRVPCRPAPHQWCSGVVWVGREIVGLQPSRLLTFGAQFGPGGRLAWHRCAYGRVVHVVHGTGRVQRRGGPVHEVIAGEWQWLGAAPNTFMAVVSAHEIDPDGGGIEWGAQVTDAEYQLPPSGAILQRPDADRVPNREACW